MRPVGNHGLVRAPFSRILDVNFNVIPSPPGGFEAKKSMCGRWQSPLVHTVRYRSSIHLEMFVTAQLDRSGERREFDGTRRRARHVEEDLVRLGVKVQVVLRCAAVWTVIGEVAVLRVLGDDLSVVGPSAKLPREGVADCPDIRDGKSVEGLAAYRAAVAMDADDLDGRLASLTGRRRGGDVRCGGGDGEFLLVLRCRQPPRVFRRRARVDVPALG